MHRAVTADQHHTRAFGAALQQFARAAHVVGQREHRVGRARRQPLPQRIGEATRPPSGRARIQQNQRGYFFRPYLPTSVALPIAFAFTMNPTSDALAPSGISSLSTFSA